MGLFLGFLSCSISLYFAFCASSVLCHTVLMTIALQYNLRSGRLISPATIFLKTALAFQGLLCFHMNCEIFCYSSVKIFTGNLIGVTSNLQIAFGSIVIFTILIFFLPRNMEYLSVIFDFFHSVLYFLCTIILSPQVSLFLDI